MRIEAIENFLIREERTLVIPTFSGETLLDQLDGDETPLVRMVALVQENTPRLLDDIRGGIAQQSADDLARLEHTLFSSLGAFGAEGAQSSTRALEAVGVNKDLREAKGRIPETRRGTGQQFQRTGTAHRRGFSARDFLMSARSVAHPRTVGWFGTTSVAMGGINQSLFILGGLFVGQGTIPGQGSAAVALLGVGLLLSWAATVPRPISISRPSWCIRATKSAT